MIYLIAIYSGYSFINYEKYVAAAKAREAKVKVVFKRTVEVDFEIGEYASSSEAIRGKEYFYNTQKVKRKAAFLVDKTKISRKTASKLILSDEEEKSEESFEAEQSDSDEGSFENGDAEGDAEKGKSAING